MVYSGLTERTLARPVQDMLLCKYTVRLVWGVCCVFTGHTAPSGGLWSPPAPAKHQHSLNTTPTTSTAASSAPQHFFRRDHRNNTPLASMPSTSAYFHSFFIDCTLPRRQVLVCGPRGSGKTATLEVALRHLRCTHRAAARAAARDRCQKKRRHLGTNGGCGAAVSTSEPPLTSSASSSSSSSSSSLSSSSSPPWLPRRSFRVVRLHGLLHQKVRGLQPGMLVSRGAKKFGHSKRTYRRPTHARHSTQRAQSTAPCLALSAQPIPTEQLPHLGTIQEQAPF